MCSSSLIRAMASSDVLLASVAFDSLSPMRRCCHNSQRSSINCYLLCRTCSCGAAWRRSARESHTSCLLWLHVSCPGGLVASPRPPVASCGNFIRPSCDDQLDRWRSGDRKTLLELPSNRLAELSSHGIISLLPERYDEGLGGAPPSPSRSSLFDVFWVFCFGINCTAVTSRGNTTE